MNTVNLASASVADIKTLVSTGVVTHADAIVRVEVVLSRRIAEGKRSRWTRLREWLAREEAQQDCVNS
jgi:hypothetical protein